MINFPIVHYSTISFFLAIGTRSPSRNHCSVSLGTGSWAVPGVSILHGASPPAAFPSGMKKDFKGKLQARNLICHQNFLTLKT